MMGFRPGWSPTSREAPIPGCGPLSMSRLCLLNPVQSGKEPRAGETEQEVEHGYGDPHLEDASGGGRDLASTEGQLRHRDQRNDGRILDQGDELSSQRRNDAPD